VGDGLAELAAPPDGSPPEAGVEMPQSQPWAPVSVPPPAESAAALAALRPSRSLRRRRSASLRPPLPRVADIPDDAHGRVNFYSAEVPFPSGRGGPVAPQATDRGRDNESPPAELATSMPPEWIAVAALGALLVLLFVVGMVATR
jgi:hypothetical protein